MKRAIGIIMAAGMAAMAVTGCGSGSQTQATTAQTTAAGGETTSGETSAPAENKEAQVITFWYNNTGDEAAVYEKAISEYNASQSNYKVEGLSVTDAQKVIVAMSSNESPDVIKDRGAVSEEWLAGKSAAICRQGIL